MEQGIIHKDNYEAYLLDRAEGRLSEELSMQLDLFLALHPELAIDTDDFAALSLAAEPVAFGDKEQIKRSEQDLVSDDMLVAYMERQLDKKDRLFVQKSMVNNAGLQAQLALYKKTILQPELDIVYPSKPALKRRNKVLWLNPGYVRYAAAAVLLLFLGLVFLWKQNPPVPKDTPLANETRIKQTQGPLPMAAETSTLAAGKTGQPLQYNQQQTVAPNVPSNPNALAKQDVPKQAPAPNPQPLPVQPDSPQLVNNPVQEKDTASVRLAVDDKQPVTNPVASSNPSKQAPVLTLAEDDEDNGAASKKKNLLWAMAGRALKGLNKAGLKSVDGNEKETKSAADYQLTFGGFHVKHSENLD